MGSIDWMDDYLGQLTGSEVAGVGGGDSKGKRNDTLIIIEIRGN